MAYYIDIFCDILCFWLVLIECCGSCQSFIFPIAAWWVSYHVLWQEEWNQFCIHWWVYSPLRTRPVWCYFAQGQSHPILHYNRKNAAALDLYHLMFCGRIVLSCELSDPGIRRIVLSASQTKKILIICAVYVI